MANDRILTWADYAEERRMAPGSIIHHREDTYRDYLTRLWEIYHDDSSLPDKPATLDALRVYVNCGRWMVTCACGRSSSPAQPHEDYLCPVCGTWQVVQWPENRQAIEDHLLTLSGHRLVAPLRNWRP